MSDCCQPDAFDGQSKGYRRALIAVVVINAVMFAVELSAGFMSGSQALKADALDFGSDAATYAISLAVIGSAASLRAKASLLKAASLAVIAALILVSTLMLALSGSPPEARTMGVVGVAALTANLTSLFILLNWREGDSNVRSVWLCTRNDAIGNVGVIAAGGLVALTQSHWPDLVVATLLAGLFLKSSVAITRQALKELRETRDTGTAIEARHEPIA